MRASGTWAYGIALRRIQSDPGSAPAVGARCLDDTCGWVAAPGADADAVGDECLAHTELNPSHRRFAREYADVAVVTCLEPA
ncbi:hypothetical protein [Streptomyces termitum]|uniref:DUF7848 domain-containing protein n=1 Tax=Streptomyces termitum TaxID=67368 RepID=UPI0033B5C397